MDRQSVEPPPPSFLAHSYLSLGVSPPPGATQPQSQLGAFLTRVQLWGSSYTVEASSIGMCKDMGEMGILPVLWRLLFAVEPQPPSSHPWQGSAQSIQPSWRGQPSLDSEVSLEFGHHAPLLIFPPEGSYRPPKGERCPFLPPESRSWLCHQEFGCKETELCCQPFLLCWRSLPKFSSTLSPS